MKKYKKTIHPFDFYSPDNSAQSEIYNPLNAQLQMLAFKHKKAQNMLNYFNDFVFLYQFMKPPSNLTEAGRNTGCRVGRVVRCSLAFTLLEVVVALALIALAVGSSIVALTHLNKAAQASRLYTGAQAVAQNHIDDAMNADWNSMLSAVQEPRAPLALGTHYVVPNTADADNDGLIAYYDPDERPSFTYSTSLPSEPNVPIYEEDPISSTGITILGTVRVVTTDISPTGANYRLRQVVVDVDYNYDNRPRNVQMTTLRAAN